MRFVVLEDGDSDLMIRVPPPEGEYEQFDLGYAGKQLRAKYPNGYGASIIIGPHSYGGSVDKYELAVCHGEDIETLCYATPITSDVVGWLPEERVVEILTEIAGLPRYEDCKHKSPRVTIDLFDDEEEGEAGLLTVLDSFIGQLRYE